MPNPHYQRVLEQDQALSAPVRWLSRAMSSWWTILVLAGFIVVYVAMAHVPIGGRYLWQWRMLDTTQHAVLTWWPLLVASWLLAIVLIWSAMRRLPWRIDNLGAFVAVLGLAIILVSQSWAFRSQSVGIAAVPITQSTGNTQADALALNYTTRYGDTHDRVLVVMAGSSAPITLPLNGIPRWNDTTGDDMPTIKLHDHPKLAAILGYGTRITTTAYLADGELTQAADGTQTAKPAEPSFRNLTQLPYPANALLALDITTDLEDGSTKTTTAWLPFEPESTDALVPKHFFPIEGLGSVGLAFRPASKKMPFALGASLAGPTDIEKDFLGNLDITDSDQDGRLLAPTRLRFLSQSSRAQAYSAIDENGRSKQYHLSWLRVIEDESDQLFSLVKISAGSTNPFILAGLITFVLGVILDRVLDWLGSRPTKPKPTSGDASASQSSIPNQTP